MIVDFIVAAIDFVSGHVDFVAVAEDFVATPVIVQRETETPKYRRKTA